MSHIPCPTRKEESSCLLQVILEHGELYGVRRRPILRDSLECDLAWDGVYNVYISHTHLR